MTLPRVWTTSLGLIVFYMLEFWKPVAKGKRLGVSLRFYQRLGILGQLGFFLYILSSGIIIGCVIKWTWEFVRRFVQRHELGVTFTNVTDPRGYISVLFEICIGYFGTGSDVLYTWCKCTNSSANSDLNTRIAITTLLPAFIAVIMMITTWKHFENQIDIRIRAD